MPAVWKVCGQPVKMMWGKAFVGNGVYPAGKKNAGETKVFETASQRRRQAGNADLYTNVEKLWTNRT